MDFMCAKCNKLLEKTADLLIKGCPNCGSKVFKTITILDETTLTTATIVTVNDRIEQTKPCEVDDQTTRFEIIPKLWENEKDDIACIQLRRKGVYDINIESLFRDKKSDPIILSGKTGIYRIEIIPNKQRK